jgi:hypothetical protein
MGEDAARGGAVRARRPPTLACRLMDATGPQRGRLTGLALREKCAAENQSRGPAGPLTERGDLLDGAGAGGRRAGGKIAVSGSHCPRRDRGSGTAPR